MKKILKKYLTASLIKYIYTQTPSSLITLDILFCIAEEILIELNNRGYYTKTLFALLNEEKSLPGSKFRRLQKELLRLANKIERKNRETIFYFHDSVLFLTDTEIYAYPISLLPAIIN